MLIIFMCVEFCSVFVIFMSSRITVFFLFGTCDALSLRSLCSDSVPNLHDAMVEGNLVDQVEKSHRHRQCPADDRWIFQAR